jgi:carboxypeptidase Taq
MSQIRSGRGSRSSYNRLLARLARVYNLRAVSSLLHYDAETFMPRAGISLRGEQSGQLMAEAHKLFASPRTRKLIDHAKAELVGTDSDSDAAHIVRLCELDYEEATRLPAKFVALQAKTRSLAKPAWATARAQNAFDVFQPHLEQLFAQAKRNADYVGYTDHPYDALLQRFERGTSTEQLRSLLSSLKDRLVPLIQRVKEQAAVDDSCLQQEFPVDKQEVFCQELVRGLGLSADRSRLDRSVHPFTSGISSPYDVRLTTRYMPERIRGSILATIHEAGHALFELGKNPEHARTPMIGMPSMGLHESQSRLWENHVGRSLEFWTHWYPRLQELFPQQLQNVSLQTFHRAFTKVSPSLIRVEADELMYNLHIILRFELEVALVEGTLKFADLPQAWNERFEQLFGVIPDTHAVGVLQDIHWAMGHIGYFPTYTLGNLMAAQIWEAALKQLPSLPQQITEGRYGDLNEWLRVNIHQHGRKYTTTELITRITGGPLSTDAFVRHLENRYLNA